MLATHRYKLSKIILIYDRNGLTHYISMHSILLLKSIFWSRQYSKLGVYMHSSYYHSHANQRIVNKPETCTSSWRWWVGMLFWFFSAKTPGNQHFFIFPLSCSLCASSIIKIWWQHLVSFACWTMEDKNLKKMTSGGMRIAAHAGTTAINQWP